MSISASRVVYIGRRLLTGQKIAYWYRELDASNTLGAAKGAFQPYRAGLPIGAVLEIRQPADDPTKILMNGPNAPRVIDSWPHPPDIESWRLDDLADTQAALTAQRAQSALQSVPDTFEQALDALAAHFARLTVIQKAALLPFVQARIFSHPTREDQREHTPRRSPHRRTPRGNRRNRARTDHHLDQPWHRDHRLRPAPIRTPHPHTWAAITINGRIRAIRTWQQPLDIIDALATPDDDISTMSDL